MRIGVAELVVIFVVALFVVGPEQLPIYAKKLGEALAQFRKYSDEATRDIKESIVEPLEEAQRPLREAVEPLNELDQTVRGNVKDVKESFSGIGKKKPSVQTQTSGTAPETDTAKRASLAESPDECSGENDTFYSEEEVI